MMVVEDADEVYRVTGLTLDVLLDWAESVLGSPVTRTDRSWPHDRSLVLQLRDRDGGRWFLKHPRDRGRFNRELYAFETALPAFGDRVPRLAGSNRQLKCLLLSAVAGEPATGSQATSPEVYRQAGAFLGGLHASLPPEPAPAMARRLTEWRDKLLARADDSLEPAQLEFVDRATAALIGVTNPMTVMCHLDYWHRNWLVDERGTLRVIDFGRADRDLAVRDFGLLAHHRWPAKPSLKDAFFDGYGRRLDEEEEAQLEGLVVLTAVKRVLRARHQGPQALQKARRLLGQMDSGPSGQQN